MNMNVKFSFKQHIAQKFFVYLVPLVVIPIVCTYSIHLKTRPKDFERFTLFTELEYKDEGKLQEELFNVLPEDLQIDLYSMERKDNLFKTYLSSYGMSSDICLLSKTTLSEFTTNKFVNLKNTKWDKEDNFYINENSVGVLYHKKGDETPNTYFDFSKADDDYYWVVLNTSVHLNGLTANSKTDQANRILEHFNG